MASSCALCSPPVLPSPTRPARPSLSLTNSQELYSSRKVYLFKNGEPTSDLVKAKRVIVPATWGKFLDETTRKLDLPFSARKLFTIEGDPILKLSQLKNGDCIVVTCGESFKQYEPRMKLLSPKSEDEPHNHNFSEQTSETGTSVSSFSDRPKRRHKKKKGKKKKLSTIGVQTQFMADTGVQTTFSSPRSVINDNTTLTRKLKIIPDEDEAPPLPPPPRGYSALVGVDSKLLPPGTRFNLSINPTEPASFDEYTDLVQRQKLLSNETRKALEDGVVPQRDDITPLNSFKFKDLNISFKTPSSADTPSNFEPQEYTVQDIELEKEINDEQKNTVYSSFYLPNESTFSLKEKGSPGSSATQIGEEIDFSLDRKQSISTELSKNISYEVLKDTRGNDSQFSSRRLSLASNASIYSTSSRDSPKSPKLTERLSKEGSPKFTSTQKLENDENLKQRVIEYFKLSRMEVDDLKSEARKLAWSRKLDDQNKFLLELTKTEESSKNLICSNLGVVKEEWAWSIFESLRSEHISPSISTEKLKFQATLVKVCEKILEHLRFTSGLDSHVAVKLGIVGPPKDTEDALAFFYKVYPTQLAFLTIKMVDKVFDLLSGQMPTTRKYQRKLVNYFKQLVIVKHVPPIPPFSQDFEHIAVPLQQLAENIHRTWNRPEGLHSFMNQVCKLPISIGELFDYREFTFVFDDFDCTYRKTFKVTKKQELQVSDSLHIYLKSVLSAHSYLVSATNSETLYKTLEAQGPTDRHSLLRSVELITTYDVITKQQFLQEYPDLDADIVIKGLKYFEVGLIKDEESQEKLISFEYYGGCAAYLSALVDVVLEWKYANTEASKEANVIYNERKKLLEAKVYQLVKSLLASKHSSRFGEAWRKSVSQSHPLVDFRIITKD